MKKLNGPMAFVLVAGLSGGALAADLNPAHVGTTGTGECTWHFVNNQTGAGAAAGTLTALFDGADTCTTGPTTVLNRTQHFHCETSGVAELLGASTNLAGNLVLSDRRLDDAAVTYAVPDAPQFRATRPAVGDQTVVRERFEPLVQEHAARQSLRPDLVRAVIQVESGFNPHARSPKGAMGLMQLMPATARDLGVHNAYDPGENIRGGTLYLRQLLDRFDGDEELALAAYNAGPNAVDRYGRRIPPYRETRDYVRKVSSATELGNGSARSTRVIYKIFEVINGAPTVRYSNERPPSGTYEILDR